MALFDEFGDMLTGGSNLGAMSSFLGSDDDDKTKGLLGMAGPALLGGLGKRAQAPGGADALFDLAKGADTGILDNIGGFLGGGDKGGAGAGLVGSILGSRRGAVESGLAQQAGVGGGMVSKLLPMLAPMLMSFIGKKVMGGGMNAGGLASMLGDNTKAMRDGGMGGILDMLDGGDDEADNAGFFSGLEKFKGLAGAGAATAAAGAVAGKVTGGVGDAASKVTGGVGSAAGSIGDGAKKAGGGMGNMLKMLLPLLAIILGVILLIWACSGGDDDDSSSSAASGGDGNYLVDLGGREVTVAIENAYLPFNYIDAATGEPGGWDYAALDDICSRLNCVPKYETTDWDGMILAVSNGQFDMAADGITITDERAEIVDFSDGYINIDQRILVSTDNDDISSVSDLEGSDCQVAVQGGTTNFDTAVDIVGEGRITQVDEFAFAIQSVISGDACATIIDETAGQGYIGENADDIKLVGDSLSADELGFIFPKGSDLVDPFNQAIAAMKADGTMAALGEEYFSGAFTITYDDIE